MRRRLAIALLVAFSWLGGLAQDARASVTVDVLFRDGTGHVLTISPGDVTGSGLRTMDIIMTSAVDLFAFGVSVAYDSDNGLALAGMSEWAGIGVAFSKTGDPTAFCGPAGGLADNDGSISQFGCLLPPWDQATPLAAGTYHLGTIIWDTSGITEGAETIAAYMDSLVDGVGAVIDGNIVDISSQMVVGSAVIGPDPDAADIPEPDPIVPEPDPDPPIVPEPEPDPDPDPVPVTPPDPVPSNPPIPEPGAATLMGLGLVVFLVTARRRLN